MYRRLLISVLVLLTAVLSVARVRAQDAARAPASGRAPVMTVALGWSGGALVAERWCPVSVTLDTGSDAVDGVVTVEYRQDQSQSVRIVQPVATTPGRVVRIDVLVCVPAAAREIVVTFVDRQTGAAVSRRYGDGLNVEAPMPELLGRSQPLVLWVGDGAMVPVSVLKAIAAPSTLAPRSADQLVRRRAADMPIASAAYESLAVLVLDAAEAPKLDPRAVSAIRQWVIGGGRLVILARGAPNDWRMLLPAGAMGELLTVGAPATGPAPASMSAVLGGAAASSAWTQRPCELTDAGRAEGWRVDWMIDDRRGLLAQGPVGFGWVTVLGADPSAAAEIRAEATSALAWCAALGVTLPAESGGAEDADQLGGDWLGRFSASGANPAEQRAIRLSLDELSDVPPVPDWLFVVVAMAGLALGLMLGVGDYFILGRRRRRYSWATALGWIGLASLVALIGPAFLGRGDTRVNRLVALDLLAAPSGRDAGGTLAFESGVTGVWAGAPLRGHLMSVGSQSRDSDGLGKGVMWRGVSSLALTQDGSDPFRVPVVMVQRPPATGSADAWGGMGAGDDTTTVIAPGGLRAERWTFRTFADQSRVSQPILAAVIPAAGPGERHTVRLGPFPKGVEPNIGALRYLHGYYGLDFEARAEADERSVMLVASVPEAPNWSRRDQWTLLSEAPPPFMWGSTFGSTRGFEFGGHFSPRLAFDLPGAIERTRAAEARLASGHWAMVLVELRQLPLDVVLPEGAGLTRGERSVMVRALVPVEPGWIPTPPEAPPQVTGPSERVPPGPSMRPPPPPLPPSPPPPRAPGPRPSEPASEPPESSSVPPGAER